MGATGGRQSGTRVARSNSTPHSPSTNANEGFHSSPGVSAAAADGPTPTLATALRGGRTPVQNPYVSAVCKPVGVRATLVRSKSCEIRSEARDEDDGRLSSSAVSKVKSDATDFGLLDSSSRSSSSRLRCNGSSSSRDPSRIFDGDGESKDFLPLDEGARFEGGVPSTEGTEPATGPSGTRKEWKERALAAMENRMEKSKGSDGGCEAVQGEVTGMDGQGLKCFNHM